MTRCGGKGAAEQETAGLRQCLGDAPTVQSAWGRTGAELREGQPPARTAALAAFLLRLQLEGVSRMLASWSQPRALLLAAAFSVWPLPLPPEQLWGGKAGGPLRSGTVRPRADILLVLQISPTRDSLSWDRS